MIVGNPPYLEKSKLDGSYSIKDFVTQDARDIYAWVMERTTHLRSSTSRSGLIVPVSLASSGSFDTLRDVVFKQKKAHWMAHFANRPGQLFSGAQNRLTIAIDSPGSSTTVFSSKYHRWDARNNERLHLFATLEYCSVGDNPRHFHGLIPKLGNSRAEAVIKKLNCRVTVATLCTRSSQFFVCWVRVPGYFCQFFIREPLAIPCDGGPPRIRGEVKSIFFRDDVTRRVVHAVLNSSIYLQFFCVYTDGRHINPSDVNDFPFDISRFTDSQKQQLVRLSKRLDESMRQNTSYWQKSGLQIESVDSRPCKSILDEIDYVFGKSLGLTDEEIDYCSSYDIKHRVGEQSDD